MPSKKPAKAPVAKASAKSAPDPSDTIASNRVVTPLLAAQLPAVPTGFLATPFEERRSRLRLVPQTQRAELLAALREAHARRATLARELGEFAPDVKGAAELADRIDGLSRTVQALAALRACHEELEDIALSDGLVLLEKLNEEFQHRKGKVSDLAAKYPHLDTLFTQRGTLISEGIARSKVSRNKPT
jgi:hypothetical protein